VVSHFIIYFLNLHQKHTVTYFLKKVRGGKFTYLIMPADGFPLSQKFYMSEQEPAFASQGVSGAR